MMAEASILPRIDTPPPSGREGGAQRWIRLRLQRRYPSRASIKASPHAPPHRNQPSAATATPPRTSLQCINTISSDEVG